MIPHILSMSTSAAPRFHCRSPPASRRHPRKSICSLAISASSQPQPSASADRKRSSIFPFNLTPLLKIAPVTLTVLSASLVRPALAESEAVAHADALSFEELRQWHGNLPTISDRIPYTDLLRLKEEGRLKQIVKIPSIFDKFQSDTILVVLDDLRVLRTVLPPPKRDTKFWSSWASLRMDDLCVYAYTPPLKVHKWQMLPPSIVGKCLPSVVSLTGKAIGFLVRMLGLLWRSLDFIKRTVPNQNTNAKPKVKGKSKSKAKGKNKVKGKTRTTPKSEKELELENMLKELADLRNANVEKGMGEKNRQMSGRKIKKRPVEPPSTPSLTSAVQTPDRWSTFWFFMQSSETAVATVGFSMFFLFYWFVVLNYKKQQKDYEDRLKIEKADREERRKMRQLEQEMQGREGTDDLGEDEEEGGQNLYLKLAKQFMRSGARMRRANEKRSSQFLDRGNNVKFSDVAGLGKIRYELEEIVKFFTHGEMYRRRGVKIPGGILLCGPPGVGKTLLAKAVAGEAGVNFFSISASQFVEIYVGVGAARVRALYQDAKENAPSVVFIDELDAVGRERGLITGSGGQERDATLNQLLVCLDGFEGKGNVVTIAATNRPDILDPALVRPGRFDRKIFIPRPGLIGRTEILQVHARSKPVSRDVDYEAVAEVTEGMVGAELANIVEVAALNVLREEKSEITTDDLLQAVEAEERGLLDNADRSLEIWKQIALNEAAMTVVAVNLPDLGNIQFVTISPRAGRSLGYARIKVDAIKYNDGMLSRQSLLDYITIQLAPRAADEICNGEDKLSTIWAKSADNARVAARVCVLGGLSDKYFGLSNFWVANRFKDIDLDALEVLNACYDRAKAILQRNRGLLDAVVHSLVEKKSLTRDEFFNLVDEHGYVEDSRPSIVDIRMDKLAKFQEMMKSTKETHGSSI